MIIRTGLLTIPIIAIPFIAYIIYDISYKNNKDKIKYFFLFIFFIYFINLLKYAVFPIYLGGDIKNAMQSESTIFETIKYNTNLIPFYRGFSKRDFLLNIIMTLPLGFLMPCLKKGLNNKKIIILGLIIGFGIETIQLLLTFVQGFTFRNININDTIANFIGVYLGYKLFIISFSILFKEFKKSKDKYIIKLKPLFNHILKLNKNIFRVKS